MFPFFYDHHNLCFDLSFRSLAVGTKNGYKLYDLKKIDKLDLLYEDSKGTSFSPVDTLF